MANPNLLDAIRAVKGNEKLALEFYADAAKNLGNHLGRVLFEQLSEFERFHYEMLTALEKSLEETGNFINYEGKEFSLPPVIEIRVADEPGPQSLLSIIDDARGLEKRAENAYADLADQLTDPRGRKMFLRLAEEEHNHYRILTDAFWSLNDTGVWKWSKP